MQDLKSILSERITINSDNWDDLGVTYKVVSFTYDYNSSAVNLVFDNGEKRTVPSHWIKKYHERPNADRSDVEPNS